MFRFYLGLWAAKFYLFVSKIFGKSRSDRSGLLAYRFDPNFLEHLNKPELVIGVTGTNGKTTVANLVNDIFKLDGKKTGYNDWFANNLAGHARCILDSVTIFNKPRRDVAILEMDEKSLVETLPYAGVDYLIITNISRDSIRRNAYPSYIAGLIRDAINNSPKTKIIMNANDPIQVAMDIKNERIYYSLDKTKDEITDYNINDFPICPKCHSKIKYEYQHYRNIGKYYCEKCNFKTKKADYVGKNIDYKKRTIDVTYDKKTSSFGIISPVIFNIFNILAVITLFKELKYSDAKLRGYIKQVGVPTSREENTKLYDKEICLQVVKGQNVSASSIIFEEFSKMKEDIELVMIFNEIDCIEDKTEVVTWLHETDFKFLNKPHIKKIIVGSYLAYDYKAAMMMQGVPEEKIVLAKDEFDAVNYVTFDGIDKVYILYDVDYISGSKVIRDAVVEKLKESRE